MDDRSPDMLRSTLISGLLFGAVAGIPFVSLLSCATCCGLVWGCGLFAAWLYSRSCRAAGVEFRPSTGTVVGLVAGAFHALGQTIVDAVFKLAFGDVAGRAALRWMEAQPGSGAGALPPGAAAFQDWAKEAVRRGLEEPISFVSIVFGFLFAVLVAAVFSTLGGLIGGALFRVAPAVPPPAEAPE